MFIPGEFDNRTTVYDFQERTGSTHKVVGIDEIVKDALHEEIDGLVVISSGNFVQALVDAVKREGLAWRLSVVNLANSYGNGHREDLLIEGNRVLATPLEREQYAAERLPSLRKLKDYTDFTPVALRRAARHALHEARFIFEEEPDYAVVPVGSGKLYSCFEDAIRDEGMRTRLVGVTPARENGIYNSHLLARDDPSDSRSVLRHSLVPHSGAVMLTAPFTAFQSKMVLSFAEGHRVLEVSNVALNNAYIRAASEGYAVEMSGAAAFCAYDSEFRSEANIPLSARVLVVSTGKGRYGHHRV